MAINRRETKLGLALTSNGAYTYLTTAEVASLTLVCGVQGDVVSLLAYTGMRFGELTGLNVEDVHLKAPHPRAPLYHSGRRQTRREQPEISRGPAMHPHPHDPPRLAQAWRAGNHLPLGFRLGLENWKRSVKWRRLRHWIAR